MTLDRVEELIVQCEAIREYSRVRKEREQLSKRVAELEETKTLTEGKTLSEAVEALKMCRKEEIRNEAKALHDEWDRKEKPKEVTRAVSAELAWLISNYSGHLTLEEQLAAQSARPLDPALVKKFHDIVERIVNGRLDGEFSRRVKSQADLELERLKKEEWPKWLRATMMPKAEELAGQIKTNALRLLQRTWRVRCDRCGMEQMLEATPEIIAQLLALEAYPDWFEFLPGHGLVECKNPNCGDFLIRHRLRIHLKDIISYYFEVGSNVKP